MFFFGFFQQSKPRRQIENRWSRLNVLIIAIQVAAYAYACIMINDKIASSTVEGFGGGTMAVNARQQAVDEWCSNTDTNPNNKFAFHRYGYTYDARVLGTYSNVLWARALYSITVTLAWNAVLIFLSIVNKVWFEVGRHAIRIRSFTIPQTLTVTAQLLVTIFCIVSLAEAETNCNIASDWQTKCSSDYSDMSNAGTAMPSYPLYAAIAIDAFFQLLVYLTYAYFGSRSCHLDVEVMTLPESSPHAGEQRFTKREPVLMINNVPTKRDRAYIEALVSQLHDQAVLEHSSSGVRPEVDRPQAPSLPTLWSPHVNAGNANASATPYPSAGVSTAPHQRTYSYGALANPTDGAAGYDPYHRPSTPQLLSANAKNNNNNPAGVSGSGLPNRRDRSAGRAKGRIWSFNR